MLQTCKHGVQLTFFNLIIVSNGYQSVHWCAKGRCPSQISLGKTTVGAAPVILFSSSKLSDFLSLPCSKIHSFGFQDFFSLFLIVSQNQKHSKKKKKTFMPKWKGISVGISIGRLEGRSRSSLKISKPKGIPTSSTNHHLLLIHYFS